jgi:hypothetical protein
MKRSERDARQGATIIHETQTHPIDFDIFNLCFGSLQFAFYYAREPIAYFSPHQSTYSPQFDQHTYRDSYPGPNLSSNIIDSIPDCIGYPLSLQWFRVQDADIEPYVNDSEYWQWVRHADNQ